MAASMIMVHIVAVIASSSASLQPLSSLPSPCRVVTVMMDRFSYPRLTATLDCGCRPHPITAPSSLEGVVEIKTPAQALEYVRFFSTEQTYTLFDFGGLVEIGGFGDSRLTADGRYLVSGEFKDVFEHVYHSPVVTDESKRVADDRRLFRIRRIAVATDGKVYEIEEYVSGNGAYALLNRTVLLQSSTSIGILHLGAI